MPLYEYQCPHCGRFELIRKFSDSPLKVCPTCGAKVQKLLSAPAIHFKGTGWYVTDYAKKGSGATAGDAAGGDAATTEKGGGDKAGDKASGEASGAKPAAPAKAAAKDSPAGGSGSST